MSSASTPTPSTPEQSSTTTGSQTTSTPASSGPSPAARGYGLRKLSYKAGAAALSPTSSAAQPVAQSGIAGASSPANAGLAAKVEASTGVDVSGARAHTGPEAQDACKQLGAEAFAYGNDVAYSSPSPSAHTQAHELAHVAQQSGVASPAAQGLHSAAAAPSATLEAEADKVADAAVSGGAAAVSIGQAPQVQKKDTRSQADPPDWAGDDTKSAKLTHMPELQSIIRYLKGTTRNSDVTAVLSQLSHWDMATIEGAWRAIHQIDPDGKWLSDILTSIEMQHMKAFPRECIATLRAANYEWQFDKLVDMTDDSAIFDKVNSEEASYAYLILKELPSGWKAKYATEHAEKSAKLYRVLPADMRSAIDAYYDPKKEAELRAKETTNRTQVGEEQAYLNKDETRKKKIQDDTIPWIKDKLSGKFIIGLTEGTAKDIFDKLVAAIQRDPTGVELRLICRSIEETKYMDRWLEKLPDGEKYAYGPKLQAFLHILRNRPAEFAVVACQRLVEGGLFGWAPSESEARLAYELIRAQPTSVQKRFREKDGGRWLDRMETHLSGDVVKDQDQWTLDDAGQLKQGVFGTAGSDKEASELAKADATLKARDAKGGQANWDLFVQMHDDLIKELTVQKAQKWWGVIATMELSLRMAMVRRLDASSLIEAMIGKLGNSYLWSEANAQRSLAVLTARDPMRSVWHVGKLVQEGRFIVLKWIDGMSKEEAKLAFEILRSLPPSYRQFIRDKFPAWESDIDSTVARDQKGNYYSGGKDQSDRMSILGQLSDASLWACAPDDANACTHLEQVIRMATAAGHRQLVYDTAKQLGMLTVHGKVLRITGIVNEAGELETRPIGEFDKEVGKALWHVAGPALKFVGYNVLLGQTDVDETLDLDRLQDLTGAGTLGGARFSRPTEEQRKAGLNKVTVSLRPTEGRLSVDIPALALDEFRMLSGDMTISTGKTTSGKVHMHATWPTEDRRDQASEFFVSVEDAHVGDLMVVMPGNMVAIKQLDMGHLEFSTAELPALAKDVSAPAEAQAALKQLLPSQGFYMPIWELAPKLMNVGSGIKDAAVGPAAMNGPGGTRLKVSGLVISGLAMSNGVHAGRIEVQGDLELQTNNLRSEHAKAQIAIIKKRIAGQDARLAELAKKEKSDDAESARLDDHEAERLKKEKGEAEQALAKLEAGMPELEAEDKEYLTLYKKQKAGATLTEVETARMRALQEKAGPGGFTLSLDGVKATGVGTQAGDNKGEVTLGGISAMGSTNKLGLGFLANPLAASQVGGPTKGAETTIEGDLAIERVQAKNLTIGGSVPDYRGQDKTKRFLEGLKAEELSAVQTRQLATLQVLWSSKVSTTGQEKTYGQAVASLLAIDGKGNDFVQLNPTLLAERERLRGLIKEQATTIESIDLRGVKLSASANGGSTTQDASEVVDGKDPSSTASLAGKFGLEVGEVDIKGVKSGDQKGVDRITGTGVKASADLTLLWENDARKGTLNKGTLDADSLKMQGVKTGAGSATVDSIDIEGAHIDASTLDGGKVHIEAKKIEARGVTIPAVLAGLQTELSGLEAVEKPSEVQKLRMQAIKDEIASYAAMEQDIEAKTVALDKLKAALKAAKTKKEKDRLGKEIYDAEKALSELKGKLDGVNTSKKVGGADSKEPAISLSGVSLTASGLGNFMDSDWDLAGKTLDIDVDIPSFTMQQFAFNSPTTNLAVTSAGFTGLKAQVALRVDGGKDEKTGAPKYSYVPTLLKHMEFATLNAQGLKVDFPVGSERLEIGIKSADFEGVLADNIPLELDKVNKATMEGAFSVEKGKADVSAKIGTYFSAGGRIAVAQKMSVNMFKGGGVAFDPGSLNLQEFGYRADGTVPPGSMVEKLKGSSATVNVTGLQTKVNFDRVSGKVEVKGPIGSLAVHDVNYDGGPHHVKLKSGALDTVTVDAALQLNPKALDCSLRGEYCPDDLLQSYQINEVTAARITGNDLVYTNEPDKMNVSLVSGYLRNVKLTNYRSGSKAFKLTASPSEKTKTDPGGPAASLTGLKFVQEGLTVNADAKVDSLSVEGFSNGGTETKLNGLTGQANVEDGGNQLGTFDINKAATLGITTSPDGKITVGAAVPSLVVSGVDYKGTTSAGKAFQVKIDGSATLTDINANVNIDIPANTDEVERDIVITLGPDAAHPMSINKAVVRNGRIVYDGLDIGIDTGTLNGLSATDMKFTLHQSKPDAKKKRVTSFVGMSGKADVLGANLTDATVMVPGLLSGKGGLNMGALNLDFMSKDNFDFSLEWIKLNRGDATLNKLWRIANIGATADNVEISGREKGEKGIKGHVDNTGMTIDVGQVSGEFGMGKTGGQLEGTAATAAEASKGKFNINLSVLDQLNSGVVIMLPGGVPIPLLFQNGHIGPDFGKMKSALSHPILDWVTPDITGKLARQAAIYIADWLDKNLRIRPMVEKKLMETLSGPTAAKPKSDPIDFQQMLSGLLSDSLLASVAVDALATGGKGVVGTLAEEAENLFFRGADAITGWNVAEYHRDQITADRAKTLRKWLGMIGIAGVLSANGPMDGSWVPADGSPTTTFGANLDVALTILGTLDTSIGLKLKAGATGLFVVSGDTTVKVEEVTLGMAVDAADKSGSLGVDSKTKFGAKGIKIIKKNAATAPPPTK